MLLMRVQQTTSMWIWQGVKNNPGLQLGQKMFFTFSQYPFRAQNIKNYINLDKNCDTQITVLYREPGSFHTYVK